MKTLKWIFPLGGLFAFLGTYPTLTISNAQEVPINSIGTDAKIASGQNPTLAKAALPTAENSRNAAGFLLAVKNENTQRSLGPATPPNSSNPTYLRDVLPIFMGKCFRCHNDQTRFLNNWLNYKTTFADRWEIKRRVWDSWRGEYFKQPMPTGNSPESEVMTEEERAIIKEWVDTGAPRGVAPIYSGSQSKAEKIDHGRRLFA